MKGEKQKYSVTSNTVKLLKHLDNLKSFQNKKSMPILVHLIITNQCNLNCSTCCFRASKNDGKYLPLKKAKEIMKQFKQLGTKSVELTGGGEPTMYKDINQLINYLHDIGYSIGINTNGTMLKQVNTWNYLTWVRLAMNVLDFFPSDKVFNLKHIRKFKPTPDITGCYVWNKKGPKNLVKVVEFANKEKIVTRIVPDCITTKKKINEQIYDIKTLLNQFKDNEYVFVSDHNVDTSERRNNNCYIHHIKPCVFVDGWVYSCPSSELSIDNEATLMKKFRVCKGIEAYEYYTNNFEVKERDCYFCKYKQQNEFLEDLLMKTEHNQFA